MLSLVERRESTYNNRAFISKSRLMTALKLVYYRLFALAYGMAGRCSDVVMCNSTWTRQHIESLWSCRAVLVHPPCGTETLRQLPLDGRRRLVVSVGQFRPEKNHSLQLQAWQMLKERERREGSGGREEARLAIIGSCRNEQDEGRVERLRREVVERGLEVGGGQADAYESKKG
jgi:alpha-1,2-mannosyltransferase